MKTLAWALVLCTLIGTATWMDVEKAWDDKSSQAWAGGIIVIVFIGFVLCAVLE